jgi:hypothetical protein
MYYRNHYTFSLSFQFSIFNCHGHILTLLQKTRNEISKFISNTIEDNNITLKIEFNYLNIYVHKIITKKCFVLMFYVKEAIKISKANCMFSKGLFKPFCFPKYPSSSSHCSSTIFSLLLIIVTPS